MKSFLKKLMAWFLVTTGINGLYLDLKLKNSLLLLRYHSIQDTDNYDELRGGLYRHLAVSKSNFEKQLNWLKRNKFNFLTFGAIHDALKEGRTLPPKSIVIYFDDGYKDNFINGYPVLKKLAIPATIFLVSDFVDQKDALWTIKIKYLISQTQAERISFGGKSFEIKNQNQKDLAIKEILRIGKLRINEEAVASETEKLTEQTGVGLNMPDFNIFLDWREVAKMRDVYELGSHSMSHKNMAKLNAAVALEELRASKENIELASGQIINSFSFPHGAYNENLIKIAREAGYEFLITTDTGPNNLAPLDTARLKSFQAPDTPDMKVFAFTIGLKTPIFKFFGRKI